MFGLNRLCKVPFEAFGNFVLTPFKFNDKLELIMVMIVFPVIFNVIQFWVFDNILKFNPEGGQSKDLLINAMEDEKEAHIKEKLEKEGGMTTELATIEPSSEEVNKEGGSSELNASSSSVDTSADPNKNVNQEISNDQKQEKLISENMGESNNENKEPAIQVETNNN